MFDPTPDYDAGEDGTIDVTVSVDSREMHVYASGDANLYVYSEDGTVLSSIDHEWWDGVGNVDVVVEDGGPVSTEIVKDALEIAAPRINDEFEGALDDMHEQLRSSDDAFQEFLDMDDSKIKKTGSFFD